MADNVLIAIRKKLISSNDILKKLGNGSASVFPARNWNEGDKPKFPCITLGREGGGDNAESAGYDITQKIDIWSKNGYDEMYSIYHDIRKLIDMTTITDTAGVSVFLYETSVNDKLYELDTRTYHMAITYSVEAIPDVATEDEWASAMASWADTFTTGWNITSNSWRTVKARPAIVFVTIGNPSFEQVGAIGFRVTKNIGAHIIGNTSKEQEDMADTVAHMAAAAVKIPINAATRTYMTVREISVNSSDPLSSAQVVLSMYRYEKRPRDKETLIGQVNINPILEGGNGNG